MNEIDFLHSFPEIKEKDNKYYLFLGIVSGLNGLETVEIIDSCLNQDIFKRKVLLSKILTSAASWPKSINDILFNKIFSSLGVLNSYFKKESASMILVSLCPYISAINQKKLLLFFLKSDYKNNRKRAYAYLLENWSQQYQGDVEEAWKAYDDEEIINLLINKMPREFLLEYFEKISSNFEEEDLDYDFHLKILRNRFYSRIAKDIPAELEKLKSKDPISFIFVMKECGKKIDPKWAVEIYRKLPQSRKYLPRWYAEMGLWEEILKGNQNLFN